MPLSDEIDATFPADNVQVDKSDMRANFAAIKVAIALTEQRSRIAWKVATGDMTMLS